MTRRLSSHQTFLVKIIFPALWLPGWGIAVLMAFVSKPENTEVASKWILLGIWVVGAAAIYWHAIRLKEVSVDEGYLYVSNYLKEIVVPLSEIYDVTENLWVNSQPVTIHLKSPSEFGDKIIFMPKARFFAFLSSHPVVDELKELARSSSMRTQSIR